MSSTPPAVPNSSPRPSEQQHRRDTLLQIVLPFLGAGLFTLLLLIIVLILPQRAQVSLVADLMVTVFVLCPIAVCLFPLYLGMVLLIYSLNKAHQAGAKQMVRVEDLSRTVTDKVIQTTDKLNRQSIALSALAAPLNRIWRVFDRPEEKHDSTDAS